MKTDSKPDYILLTGAAGFIGFHTAKNLLNKGFNVIGADNLNDYYDIRLKKYRLNQLESYNNFKFFQLDVENKEELEKLFQNYKFKSIINLAARAGIRYSIENPSVYISTNINGLLNILELMRDYSVNKIVFASTSSLYSGQEMPFTEKLPVNTPISPYAATKKAAEMLAYTFHHLYSFDVGVLRYFTVYGPAGRPDMCILRFIKWIDLGKPVVLYGDGSQRRDFTYIDDIAEGTVRALNTNGYQIINLGGGNSPYSLLFLIKNLESLLGREANIKFNAFKNEDMVDTWADISKAEKILNWKPLTNFDTGLKNTVNWYLDNKSWLDDIQF